MSTAHSPAQGRSHVPVVALGLALLALVLAAVALAWAVTREDAEPSSRVDGSGTATTETRSAAPFTQVELAGANAVTIGVGGEQLVVVRADDNLVSLVTTDVRGGALVVDTTGSYDAVTPMTVEITVPSLDGVRLSGSGTIVIDGHELDALDVALPGAGSITGAGSVSALDVDLAGSGDIDLGALVARDAKVDLSGSGTVLLNVTGKLEADVSGAGNVTFTGDPNIVERHVSGTGSVTEG